MFVNQLGCHSLILCLFNFFIDLFIHYLTCLFLQLFVYCLFIYSCNLFVFVPTFCNKLYINKHSFLHSFICSFTRSFIHSFIHSFVHSCIHLYIHSCIHSLVLSFIHSFIHLFICLSSHYSYIIWYFFIYGQPPISLLGDQMFSGDSIGAICIWNCLLTNAKSQRKSKGVTDGELQGFLACSSSQNVQLKKILCNSKVYYLVV